MRARIVVVSVAGSQSVVLMEESADNKAVIPAGLMMGTIVKMPLPETVVYGLVCGLSVPIPATDPGVPEMKIMEVELIGEVFGLSCRIIDDPETGTPLVIPAARPRPL